MLRKFWKLGLGLVLVMVLAASCGQVTEQTVGPAVQVEADSSLGQLPDGPVARPSPTPTRLHHLPRTAIVLETFYSLNQEIGGRSTKMINGCNVSDWPYLTSDMNAYRFMKAKYGSNSSTIGGGYPNGPFYTDPSGYAMVNYPGVGWVGRDGQCRFYVNLVLFRSEAYWDHDRTLWPYSTYRDDYVSKRMAMTKPIGDVMEGDVIQSTWPKLHTAIVVKIMAHNSQGKVTSVDVVDCNFVGPEIVGRHIINTSGSGVGDLDNYIALKLNYI